ncbi:MAG: DNA topoisomerase IV subunit B, partial [Myxococcota bacterium]
KIEAGKEVHWALDDADKERILRGLPKNVKPSIMRFKGLGEMNAEQLKTTTLSPKTRRALRVTLDEDSAIVMQSLMGKDPQPRYQFIMERAEDADAEALDF